ncbi:MAG: ribosome maturation factor RimM [Burkholderiales bacterium]|nr:ribosome maturation factor RimM [Burkholderiales bacterium]
MGRVAGAYGVRGWIRVAVDDPQDLSAQARWWVGGVERVLEQSQPHSGALLAKLAGVDDRGQAQALSGAAVEVPRSSLPPPEPGRYYWADLIGLEVVNEAGVVLGRVKTLFSNGAHDVIELDTPDGGPGRLLPWVPPVVSAVDLERGRIEVLWGADW